MLVSFTAQNSLSMEGALLFENIAGDARRKPINVAAAKSSATVIGRNESGRRICFAGVGKTVAMATLRASFGGYNGIRPKDSA